MPRSSARPRLRPFTISTRNRFGCQLMRGELDVSIRFHRSISQRSPSLYMMRVFHAEIQRPPPLASFHHLDQKPIRLPVDARGVGRQHSVPPFDFPTLAIFVYDAGLSCRDPAPAPACVLSPSRPETDSAAS